MATSQSFSVLVPTAALGEVEYQSLASIAKAAPEGLRDITVVVDPRCRSWARIREAERLPFVRLHFPRPTHVSVGSLLNYGLSACETDIVLRHDADDIWLPGRERHQVPMLVQGSPIVVGRALQLIRDRIRPPLLPPLPPGNLWPAILLLGNPIVHPTVGLRRDLVLDAFGPSPYSGAATAEDYLLWLETCVSRLPISVRTEYVTIYRRHPEQTSRRLTGLAIESESAHVLKLLSEHLGLKSFPPLAMTACPGTDCGHTAGDLVDYIASWREPLLILQRSFPDDFLRYRDLLMARLLLPSYRHRKGIGANALQRQAYAGSRLPGALPSTMHLLQNMIRGAILHRSPRSIRLASSGE